MIAWIGVGLLVFGEYKLYETEKLIGIAASVCLCLLGVKFLTMNAISFDPSISSFHIRFQSWFVMTPLDL